MEILTCKRCGKLYNYIQGQRICPACQKEMDEKFKEVKKFIYEHPRVGIHELAETCEVSIAQINRWIREERLSFTDDSPITINCETCGAQIRTGRYCNSCKNHLTNQMAHAAGMNKEKPRQEPRRAKENKMRFLDNQ